MNNELELDLYILTIDANNVYNRTYTHENIIQWISNLKSPGYKIEYALDVDSKYLNTLCIKNFLYCGDVTDFIIDEKNNVFGHCKFKSDYTHLSVIKSTNDLVIAPKGYGIINENKIYEYDIIGFNLITSNRSPFVKDRTL